MFSASHSLTPPPQTVKAQAERIAAGGYRCLVPDLYKGTLAEDKEEAAHLMTSLDFKIGEFSCFLELPVDASLSCQSKQKTSYKPTNQPTTH